MQLDYATAIGLWAPESCLKWKGVISLWALCVSRMDGVVGRGHWPRAPPGPQAAGPSEEGG